MWDATHRANSHGHKIQQIYEWFCFVIYMWIYEMQKHFCVWALFNTISMCVIWGNQRMNSLKPFHWVVWRVRIEPPKSQTLETHTLIFLAAWINMNLFLVVLDLFVRCRWEEGRVSQQNCRKPHTHSKLYTCHRINPCLFTTNQSPRRSICTMLWIESVARAIEKENTTE